MIIQSKQKFKWVSVSRYCWYLIPERGAAKNPVLFNQIASVGLCTEICEYDYIVQDPDDCYTVIAKGPCDSISGIEMKIDMSIPSRSPYIYTVYHPNNGSLLSSGECNSVEEGKAEVERILRENGFIC